MGDECKTCREEIARLQVRAWCAEDPMGSLPTAAARALSDIERLSAVCRSYFERNGTFPQSATKDLLDAIDSLLSGSASR